MDKFELKKGEYSWHPALEVLERCGKDPRALDDLVDRMHELGNVPFDVFVCSDRGGRWLLLSPPREIDAFFVAYSRGNVKARVLYGAEAAAELIKTVLTWGKTTAGHLSDALYETKRWFDLSDEVIGELSGRSRAVISNLMRLQKLEHSVMRYVKAGAISGAQARTLAGLSRSDQVRLSEMTVMRAWSYQQLYLAAHPSSGRKKDSSKNKIKKTPDVLYVERMVTERSGVVMEYDPSTPDMSKGVMRFKFGTVGEVGRILDLIVRVSENEVQHGAVEFVIESIDQVDRLLEGLMDE